jgi:hypothetical protein
MCAICNLQPAPSATFNLQNRQPAICNPPRFGKKQLLEKELVGTRVFLLNLLNFVPHPI